MTPLNELLSWYESLSPETLDRVVQLYSSDARFKDPFNDVTGPAAIRRIFEHMFASTQNPRFVIEQRIEQRIEQGDQAFVTWRFMFGLKGIEYQICGGSHLVFTKDGRVSLHRDYWDAAEELLQKLPLIGGPIRWLRRQFKVA